MSRGVLLGVHDERSGLDAENVIDMLRHHAAILGWDGYRKRQRRACNNTLVKLIALCPRFYSYSFSHSSFSSYPSYPSSYSYS